MATRRWISTGSGDWAATSNWSGSAVPTSGDTVIFERNQYGVSGSLNQSAVTNVTLVVKHSFTGTMGDADNYLQLGCSSVEIGRNDEARPYSGSARLNLDVGTVACTITVIQTAVAAADDGFQPVRLLCNSSSSDLRVRKGRVALASAVGETSTLDDIDYGDDAGADLVNNVLEIGSGVTVDDINQRGGCCLLRSAADVVQVWGGKLQTEGTGAIAGLRVRGGECLSNSTGTITTATLADNGTLDMQGSPAPRTISSLTMVGPHTYKHHPNVTVSAVVFDTSAPRTLRVS